MRIGIYYGSETGNSEILCEDIQSELGSGFDCHISSLADVDPSTLEPETFYIFITSTYGNGDLPSNAVPFEEAMNRDRPDLTGIRFAIFGLGDMVFSETFNQGSEKLMALLKTHKAEMLGERGIFDASGFDMPEDVALPWARGIIEMLTAKAA